MVKKDFLKLLRDNLYNLSKDPVMSESNMYFNIDETRKISDCMFNTMTQALEETGELFLVGWGTFTAKETLARIGRNPKTGESIEIPVKKVVKFKPGKYLAEKINN